MSCNGAFDAKALSAARSAMAVTEPCRRGVLSSATYCSYAAVRSSRYIVDLLLFSHEGRVDFLPAGHFIKTYSKKVKYCLYYLFFAGITAQQKVHGSPIPNQQTDTTVFYRHHQHTFAFLNLKLRSASATSSMLAAATACSVASARAMSCGQKLSMLRSPSKSPPVMCIWCSFVNRMSAQQ